MPSVSGAGGERGCNRHPGIWGKCLLTFANIISLIEVPTRAALALPLLIINNSSTVKCVLLYSVSFSASPHALQRRNLSTCKEGKHEMGR